uniref:Uncharacterized protein n=1 Tax=Manihot esculenta TaxID=3983 RepID=A0A2C9VC83_MANES
MAGNGPLLQCKFWKWPFFRIVLYDLELCCNANSGKCKLYKSFSLLAFQANDLMILTHNLWATMQQPFFHCNLKIVYHMVNPTLHNLF